MLKLQHSHKGKTTYFSQRAWEPVVWPYWRPSIVFRTSNVTLQYKATIVEQRQKKIMLLDPTFEVWFTWPGHVVGFVSLFSSLFSFRISRVGAWRFWAELGPLTSLFAAPLFPKHLGVLFGWLPLTGLSWLPCGSLESLKHRSHTHLIVMSLNGAKCSLGKF